MNATEICWRKRAIHPAAAAVARGQGPRRLWNEEPRQGGRHLRPLTYPARVGQAILCRFAETANAPSILLDLGGQTGRVAERPVSITLTEAPALKTCPKALRDKVTWDREQNTLTIAAPLSADETETLTAAVKAPASVAAIDRAAEESRTSALDFFETPAERGERFRVPQLALRFQGELKLFDDPEVLDYPWDLSTYDAAPTPDDIKALAAGFRVAEGGEIDVDAAGHITPRFLPSLERNLGLAYRPEEWDARRLATWLCRNLPEASLTHGAKRAFVAAWLAVRQQGGIRVRLLARHPGAARAHPLLGAQPGPTRGGVLLPAEGRRAFLSGFHLPTAPRAGPGGGIQGRPGLDRRRGRPLDRRALGRPLGRALPLRHGAGPGLGFDRRGARLTRTLDSASAGT